MLDIVYKVLTAICVILWPLCQQVKRVMVVSPKTESVLKFAHDLAKWLRLVVSLFR